MSSYTVVASSIMGTNANGLLIDLHLYDFFPVTQAMMYYNYIAIFFIVMWAAFAGQTNESRYTFTVPIMAALMVFIGWLHASDPASYWGSIILCIVMGAFMYLNDMNHEKSGIAGPGDKWVSAAMLIACFTASAGFVSSSAFNFFPDINTGATQNVLCGQSYQCDASGNIILDASVSEVSGSGGLGQDILSAIAALPAIALSIVKTIVIILGSVLFFSVVMLAAYPALAASPQTVAFLAVMNVVMWAIYTMGVYRMFAKPNVGGGEI